MIDSLEQLIKFPLTEIEASFDGVPFGNSDFQIDKFVVNGSLTPERAFRSVCLTMRSKINALREAYYGQQRLGVDLDEITCKLSRGDVDDFTRRRLIIDREQKLAQQVDADKLIKDAIHELNTLYKWWNVLPHIDRTSFESKEAQYFMQSLVRQTHGITGALESLANMGLDGNLQSLPKEIRTVEQLIALPKEL